MTSHGRQCVVLTNGKDELNPRDSFPAYAISISGICFVDGCDNHGAHGQEELQGDHDKSTERSRDNFCLIRAILESATKELAGQIVLT